MDVFQIEALDIGTPSELLVEKGKGSDWHLEKIVVKETNFTGQEIVFAAQTWLRDRPDRKRCASVTLNVTGQYYLRHYLCNGTILQNCRMCQCFTLV